MDRLAPGDVRNRGKASGRGHVGDVKCGPRGNQRRARHVGVLAARGLTATRGCGAGRAAWC